MDYSASSKIRMFCLLAVLFSTTFMRPPELAESRGLETASSLSQGTANQQPAAEQVYKNIQLFKGMPASELEPTMAFISGSLGVKCNHCHVNPFSKDDKPTK